MDPIVYAQTNPPEIIGNEWNGQTHSHRWDTLFCVSLLLLPFKSIRLMLIPYVVQGAVLQLATHSHSNIELNGM